MTSPDVPVGSAFLGPHHEIAVKMSAAVPEGEYFVVDPDNGGYFGTPAAAQAIPTWSRLVVAPPDDTTAAGS